MKTRFEMFGNIMIDLETLSTHKDAAIIEIGAVEFNKFTGETGETLNIIIEPDDWCKNDRHVDGETIVWWFNQSKQARDRFINLPNDVYVTDLYDALWKLKYFVMRCDSSEEDDENVLVWGNGSSFDIAILESAYNYFRMEVPWKFWSVGDVRTIVNLNPKVKENYKNNGIKHSAIDDCLNQINYLTETIKTLKIN